MSCFETSRSTYRSVQGASVEGLRGLAAHQRRFGDIQPSPPPFEVARGHRSSRPGRQPSELGLCSSFLTVWLWMEACCPLSTEESTHLCSSFPGESVLMASKQLPEPPGRAADGSSEDQAGCSGSAGVLLCVPSAFLPLSYTTRVAPWSGGFFLLRKYVQDFVWPRGLDFVCQHNDCRAVVLRSPSFLCSLHDRPMNWETRC